MLKIVEVGEYIISNSEKDILKVLALGSCIAVTAYCSTQRVLGIVHIALPESNIKYQEGKSQPGYFANTGLPLLLRELCLGYGCDKNSLLVRLFGGAQSGYFNDVFNIGERNLKAIKEILDCYGLVYDTDETGGNNSRTIEMDVATGTVKIAYQPMGI